MADDGLQAEAAKLWDDAHRAYQALGSAKVSKATEAQIERLEQDWKSKHGLWWRFVNTELLKKPRIIADSVNLAGKNPLEELY